MQRGDAVSRRYARALFGLRRRKVDREALLAELDRLTDAILQNEALRRVLFTPLHPRAARRGVIEGLADLLRLSVELRGFGALLVDENRTPKLPQIREALRELVERAAGRVRAEVVSARPLAKAEVARLQSALSKRVKAKVDVKVEVDPDLIGGVIARVGDLLLDGSVRTQLVSLRGSLRRGSA